MLSFVAGFAYGITTVVVGQPLDTIKTRMQAMSSGTMVTTAKDIIKNEGIKGLYRGGLPLVFGGGLIRSTQFGVNNSVISLLAEKKILNGTEKILGVRINVIVAGLCGGFCRLVVRQCFFKSSLSIAFLSSQWSSRGADRIHES